MCNLQRLTRAPAEVARLFGEVLGPITIGPLGNVGSEAVGETWPGQPGLVIARGKPLRQAQGERGPLTLTAMTWGFPYAAKGKDGRTLKPRPVNNARADKLDTFMWRDSFAKRRCLIPLTAFAEAEGEAGNKTRTWFSLPSDPLTLSPSKGHPEPVEGPELGLRQAQPERGVEYSANKDSAHPELVEGRAPIFAAAGLWRQTDEWGLAYTMVMTEACVQVAEVHDRMPVILRPRDWATWLDDPVGPAHAELVDVPYPELMVVERTGERWVKR